MKREKASTSEGLGAEMHKPRTGNTRSGWVAALRSRGRSRILISNSVFITYKRTHDLILSEACGMAERFKSLDNKFIGQAIRRIRVVEQETTERTEGVNK